MNPHPYQNEETLAETVEELAKEALKRGLIPSYVVHHFPDNREFYIPNERECEPLSVEQAYLKMKRLLDNEAK
ncbi:hypothetical protein [Myxacorys almedinensis]|uniref:Uncharacterized protein n=1 Tax=Myxacorys almedinensis A TaxID=2690445 RepID=A0A8J7Z4L8_9CYAN|nr:hypothetical protein [Myxacorys almedinensis]NDJ16348.1 hypothetical protein [Myxacorys almedinensis A]